jgi:hypothetical protein
MAEVFLPHFAEAFVLLLAGKILDMRSTLFSNATYRYIELVKLVNISKGGPFASNVFLPHFAEAFVLLPNQSNNPHI